MTHEAALSDCSEQSHIIGPDASAAALMHETMRHAERALRMLRQVLTPLQDARLLVDAFPCPVDPCHLSRVVALELQDPCADAALDVDALADVLQRLLPGLSGLEPLPFLDADELGKDVLGDAGKEMLGNTVTTGYM